MSVFLFSFLFWAMLYLFLLKCLGVCLSGCVGIITKKCSFCFAPVICLCGFVALLGKYLVSCRVVNIMILNLVLKYLSGVIVTDYRGYIRQTHKVCRNNCEGLVCFMYLCHTELMSSTCYPCQLLYLLATRNEGTVFFQFEYWLGVFVVFSGL
jgi:hypothetical protein